MGLDRLKLTEESALSSGYQSPVYRESSASYPPLDAMQQPVSPITLQMQLQALQMQLQGQSSTAVASQLLQPRTSGLGNASSMTMTPTRSSGLVTGGPPFASVLLVTGDPTLGAIFRQALSQAPVPSSLHLASTQELWAVIDLVRKATGRLTGPDIVFFQPDVLMANPGLVLRLKQVCGAGCPAVVLQGSEPIARALQADDFLPGPTPAHPLRKEELALMILKWRSRQQQQVSTAASSSTTITTTTLSGGVSVSTPHLGAPLASVASTTSKNGGGSASPLSAQVSQLQALQAQLQALQQAKQAQQQQHRAHSNSEIHPVLTAPAGSGTVGARASPPHRPPPLRLASAGVPPTDTYPELDRALTRSSTPVSGSANSAALYRSAGVGGGGKAVAADVSELVAQVAELRRKLGDKTRSAPMRSTTSSGGGGGTPLSPRGSLGNGGALLGSGVGVGAGPGMPAGQPNISGGGLGGGRAGAALLGGQQMSALPAAELQLKLQGLQQKQQALQQKMATGGGGSSAAVSGGAAAATAAAAASTANRTRKPGTPVLQSLGSLARPSIAASTGVPAPVAAAGPAAPQQPNTAAVATPASQLASLQLQQQLLQLQQLQLQLQQQQQRLLAGSPPNGPAVPAAAAMAAPLMITLDSLQGGRLTGTSPPGSTSGSPLPSPGSLTAAATAFQHNASGAGSDSSNVSRSNSFVAAGGTRYRPPRQRSPSPLGGAGGATSGHISDTYPGPGASRFASPQFRSGSGSGSGAAIAVSTAAGGRRGSGIGSGHTSDSGASPDFAASVRDSQRSGSTLLASKSGDDAIAAALSAASGEADAEAGSPDRSSTGGGSGAAAAKAKAGDSAAGNTTGGTGGLAEALRGLEAPGDGGSSTDGRSLMDASFALEDSGGDGRGSISGGVASSIDLLPSPGPGGRGGGGSGSPVAVTAAGPAASAAAAATAGQPERLQHSNQGGTSLGSHRFSASTIQTDPADEDETPLKASAARQPARDGPAVTAAGPQAGGQEAEPAAAAKRAAAAGSGRFEASQSMAQPSAAAATPPPRPPPEAGPMRSGSGRAAVAKAQDATTVGAMGADVLEDDSVRIASPDNSAPLPSPGQQQTKQPPAGGKDGGSGGGSSAVALTVPPEQPDSQEDDERLPSIDGSQPLPAADTNSITAAAAADGSSSSLNRQASASRAASDDRLGGAAANDAAAVATVLPSGIKTSAAAFAPGGVDGPTSEAHNRPAAAAAAAAGNDTRFAHTLSGGLAARSALPPPAPHMPSDGGSLVASIEGSITVGLPRVSSRGTGAPGRSGSAATDRTPQQSLQSSGSRGRSGTASAAPFDSGVTSSSAVASGYTEDIFWGLHGTEREASSPAPLQPPPRPTTPPARRAARILLCSHPIVITREDFLPF